MRSGILSIALLLSLTLLTILPSSYIGLNQVRAVDQTSASTSWLPFGPQSDQIIFSYYSDFSTMFTTFTTGGSNGLDITDWPTFPNQQSALCSNVDFFCGSQQANFGLDQVDINHHNNFLGIAQLTPRTLSPVGASISSTAAGCSTGFGSVTVSLKNQETGVVDMEQKFNNMTLTQVLSGGILGSATVVSGMTSATLGTYAFPCVVAGNYLLSNNEYANCPTKLACTITIGSNTSSQVTFKSNWSSTSTQQYTNAGTLTRIAIAELLDKPEFILGGPLQGNGICTDIYASQPQGFPNGFCSTGGISNPIPQPLPDDVLTQYCRFISQSESQQGIATPLNCPALITATKGTAPSKGAYLLNMSSIGSTQVWWGAQGSSSGSTNGYPSETDVRAACDLLALSASNGGPGFVISPSGSTCVDVSLAAQGTSLRTSYAHLVLPAGKQIVSYVRTDPLRKPYGQIIIDGLNFLFGTPNQTGGQSVCAVSYGYLGGPTGCNPAYYSFGQIFSIIFGDGQNPDTWNMYTGAESFGLTPDNLYGVGNSLFAGNQCGGAPAIVLANYEFECNPKMDALTNVGEFQDTSQGQASAFKHEVNIYQNASYLGAEDMVADPVFNQLQKFVALNCLNFEPGTQGSLVNGFGTGWLAGGTGAYFTYLNAHPNDNYSPTNAAYSCQDDGLRVGQSQDTDSFSPYQATSVWDFAIMNELWDSMLQVNPESGGPTLQTYNWMVQSHSSTFNPSESSCSPGVGCVTGTTTQTWHLRPDLLWQDGTPVAADDVCFSILSYRDMPAALLQPNVINVANKTATGGQGCSVINQSTVQVKLTLGGPNYDILIGTIPIIPHKYWANPCNWPLGSPEPSIVSLQASQCAGVTYDPMASGIMVGDGPYECLAVAGTPTPGALGGPCSQNGDGSPGSQVVSLGGRVLLKASPIFERGTVAGQASRYQKYSWADKFDTGIVSIGDLADAALHFKKYDPYWANPMVSSTATCSSTGGVGTGNLQCVDIGVLSIIAQYIGIGAVSPISLVSSLGLDPHIDHFDGGTAPPTGGYFLSSTQTSATTTQVSVYGDTSIGNPVATISVEAEASGGTIITGSCTASLTPIAPDGPGRTTYTCSFTSAFVEAEYTLSFTNGATTEIHTGPGQ